MDWFRDLFFAHSAIQAIVVISLISCIGIILGKIKFGNISLGLTFIFFIGIIAGHLGFSIDPDILVYVESFGLALFVYSLGLQVGPGFFNSLRVGGVKLVGLSVAIVFATTLLAVGMMYAFSISIPDMAGILCGATTNTPALGAAQETLKQLNIDGSNAALSCAVTYPLGVVGVIFAILTMRKFFVRPDDLSSPDKKHEKNIFIAEFQVTNPAIFEKSIKDIVPYTHHRFVVSRLWHNDKVSIPTSITVLHKNDTILVITSPDEVEYLTMLFGERLSKDWNTDNIDWDSIDSQLISQRIVITRSELNGKKLSSLRLRNNHGINISRVFRAGVQLLPTPDLVLQMGDRLTIVGEAKAIHNVEKILGNAVMSLKEPNLAVVFIGLTLGLILGSIPFMIPSITIPIKLGIAGGPIIVGILISTFGPRFHMITYTTRSANLMLRALGLSMFLACLGLRAGETFFETVMRPEGVLWLVCGFAITYIPTVVIGVLGMRWGKIDFGTIAGVLSGSMANPMALNYSNDTIEGDSPSVSYAAVYPICMFLRIVIIQVMIITLL